MDARRYAPATERNRAPILDVLTRHVPRGARVLEIASGTGEHAIFLAERLGVLEWQPTDPSADARASIDAWRTHASGAPIAPAIALDVHEQPWPIASADIVVCINMIHIAPWSACEALVRGAATILTGPRVLFLYGPFKRNGAHTAPSNEAFDESLRSRDLRWGVRDLENVLEVATLHGLSLTELAPMPANNFSVVLTKRS